MLLPDVGIAISHPYVCLKPNLICLEHLFSKRSFIVSFVQFKCQNCRDIRNCLGVKSALKVLVRVKELTFRNSDLAWPLPRIREYVIDVQEYVWPSNCNLTLFGMFPAFPFGFLGWVMRRLNVDSHKHSKAAAANISIITILNVWLNPSKLHVLLQWRKQQLCLF